ncbi:uncharacterized protein [Clytia hemisphaerica]
MKELKMYTFFIISSLYFESVFCTLYDQMEGTNRKLCTDDRIEVPASSHIQCTLRCKLKHMNAVVESSTQKCYCVSPNVNKQCQETVEVKADVIRTHRLPKCPAGFEGKNCNIFKGEGMELINPAISCKRIQQAYAAAKTGYYWVHLKTESVHVFCDMDTDGGGWMLIGNITTTHEKEVASRTYKNARTFNLNVLGKLHQGQHVLDGSLFNYLHSKQGITEFRIFCTKKYHGRKFHISTRKTPKGYQFRDYILGKEDKWLSQPGDCSKAVKRLPGDDSYLVEACFKHPEYVMSQALGNKESRLYDHVLYEHGNLHVQLADNARLECDDFQPKHIMNGYNQIGQWLYYVR